MYQSVMLNVLNEKKGIWNLMKSLGDKDIPLRERAVTNLVFLAIVATIEHKITDEKWLRAKLSRCLKMAVYEPEKILEMKDFVTFKTDTLFFERIRENHPDEAELKLEQTYAFFKEVWPKVEETVFKSVYGLSAAVSALTIAGKPLSRKQEDCDVLDEMVDLVLL